MPKNICPQCKQVIENGRFCTQCGVSLEMFKQQAAIPPSSPTSGHFRKAFVIIGCALIIPIVVLLSGIGGRTISGGAFLKMRNGSSIILRGLPIVLCESKHLSELIRLRQEKWNEVEAQDKECKTDPHLAEYGICKCIYLQDALSPMVKLVNDHRFKFVRTDIQGVYKIEGVPAGSYFLFVPYDDSNTEGYWLLPVKVGIFDRSLRIDLDNHNMREMYDCTLPD
jgi:hypothetical protein